MTGTDPGHRRPLLRKLSFFLLGMAVLLTVFFFYFQTKHAFKHILVPIVAAVLPGELHVQDGSLSFPATLTLTGFSYQQPDVGLSLNIDRLLIRVSVMAWLREHLFLVEELDLTDGQLRMTSRIPSSTQGDATTAAGNRARMAPFAVQHARLDNITVSIQREHDDWTARNMTLAIDDVGPGRTGTIALRSNVSCERTKSQMRWAGELLMTGTLEESRDNRQLKWDVSNTLTVREWPQQVAIPGSGAIRLDQTITGHYDFTQKTAQADSSLTLRQGDTSLGALSLTFSRNHSADGPVMDLGLQIQEVTDGALNLLVRTDGSVSLRSAHMSGFVDVHAIGEQYHIRSLFTGQNLQAVTGKGTTPPLDVDLVQTGIFDLRARTATLDVFELRVAEGDRVLLAGELNHSLTIHLGTGGAEHQYTSTRTTPQADWKMTVNGIGVAEVRQWGEVFGWKGLRGVREGRLDGTVALSGRDNGDAIDLGARLTISKVRMTNADSASDRASLQIDHEIHGTITNLTMLQLHAWIMTASTNARSVGVIRLSGTIDLGKPTRGPQLEGSIRLQDLPGEACNPLLALWTQVRIDRAVLNGTAEFKTTGDLLRWDINLRGNQMRLRISELHDTTAPLDLLVTQSGSYNRTTGVLQLDNGTMQELDRSRPVMIAALDKPVRFALAGKGADTKTPLSPDGQVATISVEAHHVGVDQLKAHLAVWSISALDGVHTGFIDGRWIAQWQGGTGTLSVTGTLDVADLRLDTGSLHISRPMGLRSRTKATILEFSRIRLESVNLAALAGTKVIAEAGLKGQSTVDDGAMDLAFTFKTDNLAKLLDRIGLLNKEQRNRFTGGSLSAEGRLTGRGQQSPLSAQATIHARELQFQIPPDHPLTYSLLAQAALELNAARTDIEFKQIAVTVESRGKAAGSLSVAGTWPLSPSRQGGAITIGVKDLDAAPLAEIFRTFPGRDHGPLRLTANVAIAGNAADGILSAQGQETLGPIRLARNRNSGEPNETTLHIEHNLSRHHDDIRATVLAVTADRPGGRADRVTASGTVRLAGPPGAQLRGEIASLDAAWYASLFSNPEPMPPAQSKPTVESGSTRPRGQSNTPAMLTSLDAEMSIGSVSYGNLMIGPGRVTAKGTGDRLEATLEATGFAEGRVNASVQLSRQEGHQELTWSGEGQGLRVDTIMQAIEPGREARLKGTGSFSTSGRALLNEDPVGTHLTGITSINIADGQFLRAPGLEFLSTYTHIKELAHMRFDSLQGTMRMDKQWIHLESVAVTGSLANLNGNLSFSPDKTVDGLIFVEVGPSLGKKIKIPCMSALLKTPEGFTALPFAVRIKGSTEQPTFSADTAGWNYVTGSMTSMAGTMKTLLRGCREDHAQ